MPDGSILVKTFYPDGTPAMERLKDSSENIFSQTYNTLDSNGRILRKQSGTDNDWYWTDHSYDLNGNLLQTTSRLGITEKWTYDALNRAISHTDGLGNIDTKTYDLQDNTLIAKDALNAGTNPYSYRNGKTLTQEVNSDYGTKAYNYNEADLLTQSLYGIRKCENTSIDALTRIGKIACTHASTTTGATEAHDFIYTYDSSRFGRLDTVTANTVYGATTNYTYDNYDRIIKKSQNNKAISTWSGTKPTLDVSYTYTTGDKLSSLTLPSGRKLTYSYSGTKPNQLTDLKLDNVALLRSIAYNTAGQMTGWNWGTGNASYTWTYDASKNGSLKKISNKNNSAVENYSIDYSYDRDGRITKLTRNNGLVDNFTYSNADRLLTETRLNGSTNVYGINYTYDKNGNRLSLAATGTHQQPNANVTYTYTGNKLTKVNTTNVSHTANFELIYGGFTPAYDYAGNRRWSGKQNGASTGYEYYMAYNHKNERTVRGYSNTNSNWKDNAVQFVYDENSHLIGEYNASGTPIVEYIWLGDQPIAAIYGSGTTAKTYWIVTDAQNTPRRLIDSTDGNTTVWAFDSTAFGIGIPSVQTVKFNLRFPGQYYDELTKQHYNLNRYYNPELGRYMEPDRIGLEGGLNPYIYANGNPLSNVDPSGLEYLASGWYNVSNPSIFSKDQTWKGIQNQFEGGTGVYYADLQKFGFEQFIDIDQQIQSSILNSNGYMNKVISSIGDNQFFNFDWSKKAFGSDYIHSFIKGKAWPFGRIAGDVSGTIIKNKDGTYLASGVINFRSDTYSWKPDYGRFLEDTGIRVFGAVLGSEPSSYYKKNNNGEMPIEYPRNFWFITPGKWK
ncbi:hypothetical protein GCM10023206_12310 [Acinetobacter puyangensis]|uniref:RHS repeat-associated core domain-containing protein n=2 Tax=Acinetobacter puyangensis TaxID=1096779 RepID=A0A240EA78_9GAMM|nr:RHS repeat-associated core domain-containing protein [Acinetobacter puyangensis]